MNRLTRIVINTYGPPLIAALLLISFFLISALFTAPIRPDVNGKLIPFVVFYAYFLATIPSLIHALLMEWIYRRYPAGTRKACMASGVSGLLAGVLIDIVFITNASQAISMDAWMLTMPALGLVVGLLLGLVIKFLTRYSESSNERLLRSIA